MEIFTLLETLEDLLEKKVNKAISYFEGGYNCSQAVFMAYSDAYGIGQETAEDVIDASNMVIYPGLINTHHHLYQTFSRNLPQVHTIVRMLRMVLECVCPADRKSVV